jgi:hypothetical protein
MKILGVEVERDRHGTREKPGTLRHLLERDAALRNVFAGEPTLQERLEELQKFQSERLLRSHADLRSSSRYGLAIEFFFNELYGGGDPSARDRDLLRVQHVMERLLPKDALHALCLAIELEVLSQELDADVVRALPAGPITLESYSQAYRSAGRRKDRERQIQLLDEIGGYLDKVVRKPIIRGLVRMARGPAHAAGFGELQEFLEHGLQAFQAMGGADEFLATIRERELRAMERTLEGVPDPFEFGNDRRAKQST